MKTLIFEGAGWEGADSCGDVGNCRIRTTFVNSNGQEIYLEMLGMKVHKYVVQAMKSFEIAGWIDHCFYTDSETSHSSGLCQLERRHLFEWNKKNILAFVNSRLSGNFDSIEIRNSNWCGFAVDGNPANDFHLTRNTQKDSLGVNRKSNKGPL